jgi:predicted  nucleic acid-binding Zn-ribbon protein
MDTGARLIKVEVEVETCKDAIAKLEHAIEELRSSQNDGFAELRASQERGFSELRVSMERGFAEQRREMNLHLRWIYGLIFTNMTFTFGIIIHLTGLI